MSHSRPNGIALALRPHDPIDFFLQSFGKHTQTDADTEREQTLPPSPTRSPSASCTLTGSTRSERVAASSTVTVFFTAVSPLVLADSPNAPSRGRRGGGAAAKFYERRENLMASVVGFRAILKEEEATRSHEGSRALRGRSIWFRWTVAERLTVSTAARRDSRRRRRAATWARALAAAGAVGSTRRACRRSSAVGIVAGRLTFTTATL
jgi:hypothetical protein